MCAPFPSSTINEYFGSGIMTKNGIILNNEMADFSIPGVTKVDGAGLPVVSRKIQPLIVYETTATSFHDSIVFKITSLQLDAFCSSVPSLHIFSNYCLLCRDCQIISHFPGHNLNSRLLNVLIHFPFWPSFSRSPARSDEYNTREKRRRKQCST